MQVVAAVGQWTAQRLRHHGAGQIHPRRQSFTQRQFSWTRISAGGCCVCCCHKARLPEPTHVGRHRQGPPAVRYRGIFLNDEYPALGGWAQERFGGFNHKFYTNVFELILRMKGNFLWPAMWNDCFGADDPLNTQLADDYGIVISSSRQR